MISLVYRVIIISLFWCGLWCGNLLGRPDWVTAEGRGNTMRKSLVITKNNRATTNCQSALRLPLSTKRLKIAIDGEHIRYAGHSTIDWLLKDYEKEGIREAIEASGDRVVIKSLGVGSGLELSQVLEILKDYDKEVVIYGYDVARDKIESVRKLFRHYDMDITLNLVYMDLLDELEYPKLLFEKADILLCRNVWLAIHGNWGAKRTADFIEILVDNVKTGGYITITNLGQPYTLRDIDGIKNRRVGI